MRVIIIGSGLSGLTAAYFLAREKVDVMVIDRAGGPGLETSFANGALLAPSSVAPWNSPGLPGLLLRSFARRGAPVLIRPRQMLALAGWGFRFLANARESPHRRATLKNTALARYSRQVLDELMQQESLEFGFQATGTLCLYRDKTSLRTAMAQPELVAHAGVRHERLEVDGIVELEPELEPISKDLKGGLYFPEDALGDAYDFCRSLHKLCEREGVKFRFSETVTKLHSQAGRLTQLQTERDETERDTHQTEETERDTHRADAYLVAAGSYSASLVASLGLRLPVRPAKGYSITLPRAALKTRHPVLDRDQHIVVTPLGDQLRVAGTAEFAGFDRHLRARRIDNLIHQFGKVYPRHAASLRREQIREWVGLRPMTPDGLPFLGATPISNLYLNTGHGPIGWTLACGSDKSVADDILGRTPSIDISDFSYQGRA